jgi:hypothetical protein
VRNPGIARRKAPKIPLCDPPGDPKRPDLEGDKYNNFVAFSVFAKRATTRQTVGGVGGDFSAVFRRTRATNTTTLSPLSPLPPLSTDHPSRDVTADGAGLSPGHPALRR